MSHHGGPGNDVYNPHSTKALRGYTQQSQDISGEHKQGTPNNEHAITVQSPTCILHTTILMVPVAPLHMGCKVLAC